MPDVAAVILAHNAEATLGSVLDAIQRQTLSPSRTIVIDNGSLDDTVEKARGRSASQVIASDVNVGVGAGHNLGWSHVINLGSADLIWSLEHDTLPAPDCLELLVGQYSELLNDGRRVGVVAPIQRHPESVLVELSLEPPHRSGHFTFNGALFSIPMIKEIGMLREDLFVGHEDREYAARCIEAGYELWRLPAAYVVHGNKGASRLHQLSPARLYYGARNELLLKLERASPGRSVWLGVRSLGGTVRMLGIREYGVRHIVAKLMATRDAFLRRVGEKCYHFMETEGRGET